ncbi:AAA family ATPase [Thermomonospora umbrina]|nr:AAA family ATPase [Thermomonospora umbrina]
MSAAVSDFVINRVTGNALKQRPSTFAGIMLTGGAYQGKTETICEALAAFEDDWRALHQMLNPDAIAGCRDLHVPVAYIQTPVTATPKSTCQAILDFYGERYVGMSLPRLIKAVRDALRAHGTRVLALDDITRLKMHREADQDVLDLIRSLMSMSVTLVLIGVGIPSSGLLREGHFDAATGQWVFPPITTRGRSYNDAAAGQTERRFDLISLEPFRYNTGDQIDAWVTHLAGIEDQLRLLQAAPGMLTDGDMPEYLFRRTNGIVGLLERLLEDGCTAAMKSGEEQLSIRLLDTITISLGNLQAKDPAAGEIPEIPPRQPKKPRKPRNSSFDDHGHPEPGDDAPEAETGT